MRELENTIYTEIADRLGIHIPNEPYVWKFKKHMKANPDEVRMAYNKLVEHDKTPESFREDTTKYVEFLEKAFTEASKSLQKETADENETKRKNYEIYRKDLAKAQEMIKEITPYIEKVAKSETICRRTSRFKKQWYEVELNFEIKKL